MQRGFKAQAERLALRERELLGLSGGCRLNPRDLARAHGIPVVDLSRLPGLAAVDRAQLGARDPAAFSGITVVERDARLIVVNDAHTPERQANTLAHELAHCLLGHAPSPLFGRFGRELDKSAEDEADWFAGCLLVPGAGVRERMRLSYDDLTVAAAHYGVSVELMRWRRNVTQWRQRREAA